MQAQTDEELPGGMAREQVLVKDEFELERCATDRTGDQRGRDEPRSEGSGCDRHDGKARQQRRARPGRVVVGPAVYASTKDVMAL